MREKAATARWLVLVIGLLSFGGGRPLAAQQPPQPQSAPTRADSAAILLDAAVRLDRSGRSDAAGALYEMIIDRYGGTPAAGEARALLSRAPGGRSTRSGRVELQVWTTLYGLWLGVAVPAAFGADGPEPYGIGLLVGGPAGFLTGLGLARSRELTDGQARAITFGGTWGTWQGFGWASVFDWGDGYQCDVDLCVDSGSAEEKFVAMIAGGLAGVGTGIILSRRPITSGVATSVSLGSMWGTWFGLATGVMADLEGDDLLAATLIGGNAGLVSAALIAHRAGMSRNRARLISIAGVVGGLAGGGIDLIVQPDNEKVGIAIPLIGSLAGLAVGTVTTRNFDRPAPEPGGDTDNALIRMNDGRWVVGAPMPTLVMRRAELNGRSVRVPALGLTLLSAKF